MAENEDKGLEDENAPPPESILDSGKQRDPDEAVFAEQAIHHYASDVLEQFRQSIETATSAFTAWVESQNSPQTFDNGGFNAQIGDVFLQQMVSSCGGRDTPIGGAMFDQLEGLVDEAVRQEDETSYFVEALTRGARDFTWYLRDNLQGVLTNEWDQLRDLAYEGSTDFIPALHAFGLPKADWSPASSRRWCRSPSSCARTRPRRRKRRSKKIRSKSNKRSSSSCSIKKRKKPADRPPTADS
jgi:hypothetical protein